MRYQTLFTDEEWGLIVGLPQSVLSAASAAESDGGRRTLAEGEAGLEAISAGRESGNPFVTAVATELISRIGDPENGEAPPVIEPEDAAAAAADALERAARAAVLLAAKVDEGDAGAYKHWLVTIADHVVTAGPPAGVLGLGGEPVTESERRFRDGLARVLND